MSYLASTNKIRNTLKDHLAQREKSSIIFTALGIFVILEARTMKLGDFSEPGPGLFPLLLGIFLVLLSAVLFNSKAEKATKPAEKPRLKNVYYVLGSLLFFVVGLKLFGYIVTTFLMFVCLLKFIGGKNWSFAASWSAIIAGISYLIFGKWLMVLFPGGMLPLP